MSEVRQDSVVTLREVTVDNLRELLRLEVAADQTSFVAPNSISVAQAYFHRETAWMRGIYADETPVGFIMLSDKPREPEYFLWRLMIDQRYQGLGFGAAAVKQLIDYVKTRPSATELLVSYVPEAGSPGPFYAKLGFAETGRVEEGERIMRLPLTYTGETRPVPALGKPITHIVMARLKEPTQENIDEAVAMARTMAGRIDGLKSLEVGADIVRSERSYDLALIARFEDRAGLEAYNTHPAHLPVVAYLRARVSSMTAVDFET